MSLLTRLDGRLGRALAALASGVMLISVNGLHPWWPLAWVAPIPLLAAAFTAPAGQAWWLGAGAGLVGGLGTVGYFAEVTSPVVAVVLTLARALAWAFVVMGARRVVRGSRGWTTVFAYPVLWAAVDTLAAAVSPHGSAGSMAYSQMDALPVIQVAALAGAPGIVFTVSLFSSLVAVVATRGRGLDRPWLACALPALLLIAVVGGGAARLAGRATDVQTLEVGLAAIDTPRGASGDSLWAAYAQGAAMLAGRGARVVVLPEKIAALDAPAVERVRRTLQETASRHAVYLVAGVTVLVPGGKENRAWMFSPAGELVADYSKQHLIPGLEGAFIPGTTDVVRALDATTAGVAICKDMDFPALGRHYATEGARIMLVPAFDFDRDAWQHARMAILRGVESGFTIARSARRGLMTVSDRYGHVIAERSSMQGRMVGASEPAPLDGAPTPYARFGDVFGWLCVILAAGLLVRAWRLGDAPLSPAAPPGAAAPSPAPPPPAPPAAS